MPRAEVEIGQPRTATMEKDSSKSNISQHSGNRSSVADDNSPLPALSSKPGKERATGDNDCDDDISSEFEVEARKLAGCTLRALSTPPHTACSDTPIVERHSVAKRDASPPKFGGLDRFM